MLYHKLFFILESQVDYLDTANKNNFTYTISSFITGCLFWNEETDNWSTDGCQVKNVVM